MKHNDKWDIYRVNIELQLKYPGSDEAKTCQVINVLTYVNASKFWTSDNSK